MVTNEEVQKLRARLLALRERVDADFAQVRQEAFRGSGGESGGGISNTPVHLADLGSQEFDEAVTLGLAENEATLLQEIENALDRIRAGKFGRCEACGQAIPKERLNILPYARHCIPCARKTQGETGR
jgi:RNA polymerase-binding transcription factor DksA